VASTDWSVDSFDGLMDRAAEALLQARREGRNRVVAAR
jgi:PleD family two-component response regulator